MRKKLLPVTVIVLLMVTSLSLPDQHKIFANTMEEIQKELEKVKDRQKEVNQKQAQLENEVSQTEEQIAENRARQNQINAQIKDIDMKLADTNAKIRTKEEEITNTEKEIKQLNQEIEELKKRIAKREELLKDRLRTLQRNGGSISYLEVVLGAKSFGDFLDRSTAVTKIMNQDKRIMDKHTAEKNMLEQVEAELEDKKVELVAQKEDLENLFQQLEAQRNEKQRLMAELQKEEQELKEYVLSLEEQEEILRQTEATLKKMVEDLKNQLEQLREGNGQFMRPAQGPVTSRFGPRWGDYHYGIDIGRRGRDVPIVAAYSGYVIKSYYSSSYGNVVFLAHTIDGQLYTTVYAHMENREVKDGDFVKKGQRLGYMGNTGHSTGPHLHFEIHKGSWTYDKRNAVNPEKFIKF
ncbi:MAG: peptidoglycan DD-metalloendopeptidase family protein [Bacillaceae bacterium]|nr:peptidoglycan DD-metalloendopeptidase family protein [Bacillaceae bacterium]